jgi:hypothetical protein
MEESDIEIQVKEVKDMYWGGDLRTSVFSRVNVPDHIDCSNSICHGGGISKSLIIRAITDILEGNEKQSIVKKCQGQEGSKKGRVKYRSCFHAFKITVEKLEDE